MFFSNKIKSNCSFQEPSFLSGLGTTINIFGNYYPFVPKSDSSSLSSDWEIIGNDWGEVLEKFDSQSNLKERNY